MPLAALGITTGAGIGLFTLWDRNSSSPRRGSFQGLAAIGLDVQFVVPAVAIQASVSKPEDQGLSVGLLVSFRLFGALTGLEVGSTAFSSVFGTSIASLGQLPEWVTILGNPSQAVSLIPLLRATDLAPDVMDAVREGYNDAFKAVWYAIAASDSCPPCW